MRLIDADSVPFPNDMSGCGYEGNEYLAYKSGAEYGRGLVDDAPTIDPESLRPTAKWIVTKTAVCGINKYKCSSCGTLRFSEIALHMNYCQNCELWQKDGERI